MKQFGISKGKKEYYFVIALAVLLVFVVLGIVYVISQSKETPEIIEETTIPTGVPTPTIPQTFTNPPVPYDLEAQQVLLDRKINRKELSPSDVQLKQEIIALLPEGQIAGVVHETETVRIEYIESLDLFKGEILTTNVAQAKDEAMVWFRSQGMSQQGICDLPLGFYLNWEVSNLLRNSNYIFNPLPEECL